MTSSDRIRSARAKAPSRDGVAAEIRRFDPALPIEKASTPPASWYVDADFHRFEMDAVMGCNWLVAARDDQLDIPGKYVTGDVAGERYLIVRGEDGELRAFYNVCRHHAAAVASGEGRAKRFSCPYHGWTYGLDGALLNAPELGGVEDFDPACNGLVPMSVETWGPLVFISLHGKPGPLDRALAPLKSDLDRMDLAALEFARRQTYSLRCNWKVFVDNYLDGGYHVAYLHRGLASQLDLSSYETRLYDRFSVQTGAGAAAAKKTHRHSAATTKNPQETGGDFAERIGERVLYAWLYPNLMINRYGPVMDTNWVIPVGPDRTDVIFDYYFLDTGGPKAQDFIEKAIAASDTVQLEDMEICEAVQRGLESRAYDRGRYSAVREMGELHFHRLLTKDLSKYLGP